MLLAIISLLTFLSSMEVFAQTHPEIRTGRPGQSIGPFAVGDKIIQLQTGYQLDDNDTRDSHTINNVIRYGIGENFEISSVFDFRDLNSSIDGFDNLQFGARYSFAKTEWYEALGLQLRTRFKGGGDFKRERQSYVFLSALTLPSFHDFSFSTNLGLTTDGSDPYIQKTYTLNISYPLSDKLGIFLEPYGVKQREQNVLSLNTGVGYTVTSDFALDFSLGQDISNGDNRFLSFGFSIRS